MGMHAGLSLVFQNLDGHLSDAEMYRFELGLAARAEAVGFDSVWTPEHHFSDYQLTPNVPQFLAWVAGQASARPPNTGAKCCPVLTRPCSVLAMPARCASTTAR